MAGESRRRVRRREEPNHGKEEGRLRPGQVIGTSAVRRMPVRVDKIGEVLNHVLEQIRPAAFGEAAKSPANSGRKRSFSESAPGVRLMGSRSLPARCRM